MKAFIQKEPNKRLYRIHGKVKLTCILGINHSTDVKYYILEWYKISFDRPQRKRVDKLKIGGPHGEYVLLDPLTREDEGKYECVVKRKVVNFLDAKLTSVILEGK